MNKRYNEELSYYNSLDLNNSFNNNFINNNINSNINYNNYLINSKSILTSNNNSLCKGYSELFINSVL